MPGQQIRVTGTVQGVGFRPTVWRLAKECALLGSVWNDAEGVLIQAWGEADNLAEFTQRLKDEQPPLSQIENIVSTAITDKPPTSDDFQIISSQPGAVHTAVAADAATCPECLNEIFDRSNRRYGYPFTNCTHCGPRLSIIKAVPYDRANTSMAVFPMCPACLQEYENPADRRFHAQPNACQECGPQIWLEDKQGEKLKLAVDKVVSHAVDLINQGFIVAIKGIGGIHLACDATNEHAVNNLRQRKRRYYKALALMASDFAMIRRYADLSDAEAKLLTDKAAPIVVLNQKKPNQKPQGQNTNTDKALASAVAPGQATLGFMLPYSPLHHLLMRELKIPIVLTSGNQSDEPQVIKNQDALTQLQTIADFYLLHDREIVNRQDDSVIRLVNGEARFLRRARGYAPQPILLPEGFDSNRQILAMGAELKNTFCLLKDGRAILSSHMGDLEDASTYADYRYNLSLFRQLFDFKATEIAVDCHPNYLSTQLGRTQAAEENIRLVEVQHHHAHIAACMAEHGLPINADKVMGVALDGLGFGANGELWGGEFLLADYRSYQRLGHFQAVPMLGGAKAMYEPWRNTFAQLSLNLGWQNVRSDYAHLDIVKFLETKPLLTLQQMADKNLNSPKASSVGRLFDAVAAALGICRETAGFEGQAAIELEALASHCFADQAAQAYRFELGKNCVSAAPMWQSLLRDLADGIGNGIIAARFHHAVAKAVADLSIEFCREYQLHTVVLSGGVFQNRLLLEQTQVLLSKPGLKVLSPIETPANDGGLSLGQAVIAFATSATNC